MKKKRGVSWEGCPNEANYAEVIDRDFIGVSSHPFGSALAQIFLSRRDAVSAREGRSAEFAI